MVESSATLAGLGALSVFLLKGFCLLSGAASLACLAAAKSAALRHLIWTAGTISILCLVIFPSLQLWSVPLPAWIQPDLNSLPPTPPLSMSLGPNLGRGLESSGGTEGTEFEAIRASHYSDRSRTVPPRHISWTATTILSLWGLGALAGIGRMIGGELRARRIVKRATLVCDEVLLAGVHRVVRDLGVTRRRLRVLVSTMTLSPFTRGTLKPILVLPAEYTDWPRDRQTRILVHEIAHIRRFDFLTFRIAEFVAVLQWLNPLVWVALKRVRQEQELACDDQVLVS